MASMCLKAFATIAPTVRSEKVAEKSAAGGAPEKARENSEIDSSPFSRTIKSNVGTNARKVEVLASLMFLQPMGPCVSRCFRRIR
jgi:hypothetical protein